MKQKRYLIIIPELILTGPSKGAVALANGLFSLGKKVWLISLKGDNTYINELNLNAKIKVSILDRGTLFKKFKILRKDILCIAPDYRISFGFSADLLNMLIPSNNSAVKCSSVRGNLFVNYRLDYGKKGLLLAIIHYLIIKRQAIVISITKAMQNDLKKWFNIDSFFIGNFVDEETLRHYRTENRIRKNDLITFVFLGSLTVRKNVLFLIESFESFSEIYENTQLILMGDGPLREVIEEKIKSSKAPISYKGFISDPYELLSQTHVFVLLSSSEGMSRAALEALFLGNIGLLSDVEGNNELIVENSNGFLYNIRTDNIVAKFEECVELVNRRENKTINHLPTHFRQKIQVKRLIDLLEKNESK